MKSERRAKNTSRAGLTAIEMAIGLALFIVLSGTVMQTMRSMRTMALVGDVQSRVQRDAERALEAIVLDLGRSGFVEVDGRSYPHLIVDGTPESEFDPENGPHHHAQAAKTAQPGDTDAGRDIGILFLLPAMWPNALLAADPDQARRWPHGRPVVVTDTGVFGPGLAVDSDDPAFEVAENGMLVWNVGNPVSYSLRTDLKGRNTIVRTESSGASRIVARDVERLLFERGPTPEIPLDAVRVRIFFRVPDDQRQIHRFRVEATVRLKNGTTGN